jgi:ABC-type tungstate transport system substrate-binding protein
MSGLDLNRVTRVIDTSYAVAHPKGNFASGRAEDSLLFHKNVALRATFL